MSEKITAKLRAAVRFLRVFAKWLVIASVTGAAGGLIGAAFHLSVDGPVTDELLDQARKAAEEVLSNPIIEDVVRVEAIDEADARYAGGVQ